jgi:2-polyprenyl-3-methyl-5-hydroxy-6-metoxy-1,4-benzoquinol methylase
MIQTQKSQILTECTSTGWAPNETGEYRYQNAELNNSHSYLVPAVQRLTRDVNSGAVVMDFGCGNGSLLATLRDRQWRLHGLDFSTTGVEHARRAYPFIEFTVGDVASDSFTHRLIGQCDLVISTEVVEHVFLPRPFARNCFKLLKPGGSLIVTTPYHGYLKNVVLSLTGRMDHHFHALWDYGHIKFWSPATLTTLLTEAGFEKYEFHGVGRLPYLWKSMLLKCAKPLRS